MLPANITQDMTDARGRGLELAGPNPGGRVRPDGQQVEWQTARAATSDVPFLCGDRTPCALRVPDGAAQQHANGALGVAGMTVAVENLDTIVEGIAIGHSFSTQLRRHRQRPYAAKARALRAGAATNSNRAPWVWRGSSAPSRVSELTTTATAYGPSPCRARCSRNAAPAGPLASEGDASVMRVPPRYAAAARMPNPATTAGEATNGSPSSA